MIGRPEPRSTTPLTGGSDHLPLTGGERTDQVLHLGEEVSLEGRLFIQKFYTSSDDPKYKGRTAFLPIILSDRLLVFSLTNLDSDFLPKGVDAPGPSDRIELMLAEAGLIGKHEQAEGKRARVMGSLVMDQQNRLLPVQFAVARIDILE